jgi:hypothetical protein
MLPRLPCFPRDRSPAVKNVTRATEHSPCHTAVTRVRRGLKASIKTAWRRTSTGSNHICAHGVWRDHARRARARVNRTGETRWHRVPAVARAVHFLARGSSK